jgi:hypothetical protein
MLDMEGFLCTYNPLHFGVATGMYGTSTHPNGGRGYLLPSQQLNLEDHAISDIHLLGFFSTEVFRLSCFEWSEY